MEAYYLGNRDADRVLIQMVDDNDLSHIEKEIGYLRELSSNDFCLIAVKIDDWNNNLSPWNAPAVFGGYAFGSGAENTLEYLIREIVEPINDGYIKRRFYLGGYSLAGLFSLWAAYKVDIFDGVAGVSPSVWFPGFVDFVKEHRIKTGNVYLSLGEREERTKNVVMAQVGSSIRAIYDILGDDNISCILEWNKGNHFQESDLRTAKGFSWLLTR